MDINEVIFAILIAPIIFIGLGIGFGIFFASMTGKKRAIPIGILCSIVVYVLYLCELKIPFYKLNPAYYKFQSECKKLPKPVIYNQDYWEAFTDDSKLKVVENGGGRYSAKLDKTFIATKWFKEDKVDEKETWWGNVRVAQRFYDGVHYATTTGYSYNGLVFRFGASKISFGYETLKCYNYKRK